MLSAIITVYNTSIFNDHYQTVNLKCTTCIHVFSYTGGRSADDIINFINSKADARGKMKKEVSHVVDLNPSNFEDIVLNPEKNVLVEFYAPCKCVCVCACVYVCVRVHVCVCQLSLLSNFNKPDLFLLFQGVATAKRLPLHTRK